MHRLFIGIALPLSLRQEIHALQGGIPDARWTALENYHITLSFIGGADALLAEEIDDALCDLRAPAFDLTVKGTGSFAQGSHPKVLWLGVAPSPALSALKEKIDATLLSRKIPFEKRKYIPHVTLARFREAHEGKLADFMQAHHHFSAPAFAVQHFTLYESCGRQKSLHYVPLRHYALQAPERVPLTGPETETETGPEIGLEPGQGQDQISQAPCKSLE